jgi:hypothetical protein
MATSYTVNVHSNTQDFSNLTERDVYVRAACPDKGAYIKKATVSPSGKVYNSVNICSGYAFNADPDTQVLIADVDMEINVD